MTLGQAVTGLVWPTCLRETFPQSDHPHRSPSSRNAIPPARPKMLFCPPIPSIGAT